MVRRNPDLSFGGLWTFPGGVLEDSDGPAPDAPDENSQNWGDPTLLSTAANAAIRETIEETALVCDRGSLAWFSHWIPPVVGPPKRFATWFFLAPEHRGEIVVDTGENDEARWVSPSAALEESSRGAFPLTIPTWVTLDDLRASDSIPQLMDTTVTRGPAFMHTKALAHGEERIVCWSGDAAYETESIETPGSRNRVLATSEGAVIERIKD